jgi:hypothetical protein
MATHKLRYAGQGVARVKVSNSPNVTFVGSGERALTLGKGTHRITFGISGQKGDKWSLGVVTADDDETAVYAKKGTLPAVGLEVRTDEFEV